MPPQLDVAEREAEICRLWQAQWTARKIAEHLDVRICVPLRREGYGHIASQGVTGKRRGGRHK